ncbi:MAG: hypothetical protein Q8O55_10365 [Dehalococcoidales bacterium]|nr:hypothetical protein [Dehalococcoidales bacterium]
MIKLILKREVVLSGLWCSKQEFDGVYKDDFPALIELLNEDLVQVIKEAGGLEGLIESAVWEEA